MTRLLPLLLALSACAGSVYPSEQTPAERCENARRVVIAMDVTGAWGFAVEQAAREAEAVCAMVPEP